MTRHLLAVAVPILLLASASSGAQQRVMTTQDYARAEQLLAPTTNPLVFRAGVQPTWLGGDRFWYRVRLPDGTAPMIVVDAAKATKLNCATSAAKCAALVPPNANANATRSRRAGRFPESMKLSTTFTVSPCFNRKPGLVRERALRCLHSRSSISRISFAVLIVNRPASAIVGSSLRRWPLLASRVTITQMSKTYVLDCNRKTQICLASACPLLGPLLGRTRTIVPFCRRARGEE